ncbi:DUF2637 domain-containing protein [Actinacidiphila sp. bgisy144]|uniref:DUF2637 domain-containing protein n=1 Tax=Actinacidiphila sp. bgisy144 TaxID=3413791 RepID=UPI003EBBB9BC
MPSPHPHALVSAPAPSARHRPRLFDQVAVLLLGACACVMSFDALRQVALATHIRPALSYLFPVVIDGFIAYGVRAILLLRDAPRGARRYAWTLFGTATAASLWANALHALRLNSPGARTLTLDNHTVAVLSAIAPLALGGATHLHILVSRHAHPEPAEVSTSHPAPAAPSPVVPAGAGPVPADPAADTATRPDTPGTDKHETAAFTTPAGNPHPEPARPAPESRTVHGPQRASPSTRSGRRPKATIDQLATVLAATHPDPAAVSRTTARTTLEAAGLPAGNDRITQTLERLRRNDTARPHPPTD